MTQLQSLPMAQHGMAAHFEVAQKQGKLAKQHNEHTTHGSLIVIKPVHTLTILNRWAMAMDKRATRTSLALPRALTPGSILTGQHH